MLGELVDEDPIEEVVLWILDCILERKAQGVHGGDCAGTELTQTPEPLLLQLHLATMVAEATDTGSARITVHVRVRRSSRIRFVNVPL